MGTSRESFGSTVSLFPIQKKKKNSAILNIKRESNKKI